MKHIIYYILAALLICVAAPLSGQGSTIGQPDPSQLRSKSPAATPAQRRVDMATLVTRKEREIDALVVQFRRSAPADQQQFRYDIEKALRQLFELKLRQREQALRALEAEIEEVQASLEENRRNKDAIVLKRLEDLLGKQ